MKHVIDLPMSKAILVGVLLLCTTGCATVQDIGTAGVLRLRVERAWRHASIVAKSSAHPRHFTKGWKRGYYNVANGSDGQVPAVPPDHYWSVLYQSARGREQVAAWFDGYSHGAAAANVDGVALLHQIPTSSDTYADEVSGWEVDMLPEDRAQEEESPELILEPAGLGLLEPKKATSKSNAAEKSVTIGLKISGDATFDTQLSQKSESSINSAGSLPNTVQSVTHNAKLDDRLSAKDSIIPVAPVPNPTLNALIRKSKVLATQPPRNTRIRATNLRQD